MYEHDENEPSSEAEICVRIPASAIAGLNKARIEELVADHIAKQADRERGEAIAQVVAQKTQEAIDSTTADLVRVAVEEAIREGWFGPSDSWNRNPEKKTLRDRVDALLNSKKDNYNDKSLLRVITEEQTAKAIAAQIEPQAKRAAEEFKAQIDNVLKAKIAETMRQALGLGRG